MKSLFRMFVVGVFAALLAVAQVPFASAAEETNRPNILFILTDDQGWSTLGCYGNRVLPTPHLDRLASEGARFTDAYVMPQCTPTRAALFTGQHTARTGMWHVLTTPWYGYPWAPIQEPAFREGMPRDWFTLPKGLRSAGYATGMAGKWHLTANEDGNYVALSPEAADAYGFDYVAPKGPGTQNDGDKWVDHLTDSAIQFIDKFQERPWFFYLAHHTLHGKVNAPADLIARHKANGAPKTGLNNATYLAAIEHLDDSVGRLMKALDDRQLRERTVVVFLSDNGGVSRAYDAEPFTTGPGTSRQLQIGKEEFSNHPLRGPKGSPYEGGIRVPCLVRWPNVVQPQSEISTPIHVVDWLPTLLEMAEAQMPKTHQADGVSLVPLLRGKSLAERSLYWHVPLYDLRWGATPCAMIRQGDWKLIEYFGDRFDDQGTYHDGHQVELYNLREDLAEANNLSEKQGARKEKLLADLHEFLKDCRAAIPQANPHYDPSQLFRETSKKPDFLLQP